MPEGNQNMQTSSSLRAETDSFQRMKELLRKRISNDFNTQREKENQILYEKSLTSTDHGTCWQYDRACKVWEMARWIRNYGTSLGYDWSNVEDLDLVQQYSDAVPNAWAIMYDYITQSQEDDPMPYYIKLWFEQETDEDRANTWFKNMRWSFDKAWQWLRTMYNVKKDSESRIKWWQYDQWAVQDYAYDVYWRKHPFSPITDEEWNAVERDLRIDPSLLDKYLSQAWAIKDTIMWWVVSAMNTTPIWLGINVWTAWVASTTPWEWVFWKLWEWAETVGYYANKFPWLKQYRDVLPTEEDKRERDQFVWQEIIALITRWAIKSYKEIKKMANDGWTWWWGGFWWWLWEKFQENRKLKNQEKLQDTAWLISKPKTTEELNMATRALQDVDLEGVKDYVDMDVRFNEKKSELLNAENEEYAKDNRKFKPEDTSEIKIYEIEWDKYIDEWERSVVDEWSWPQNVKYVTAKTNKYVQPMINLLKEFYSWNPDKMAKLELVEQKFNTEWLTKAEINQLTRDIATEYDSYTKRWKPKETIEAQDVEWIRKTWKYFARWDNADLIQLDRRLSDNMNTQQMIKDLRDEIVRAKATISKKNLPQKIMSVIGDLLNVSWVKSLLFKLIPNAVWEEKISPLTRQKNLRNYIKKFESLNKKLNWAKTKAESQKIIEDFIDDVEKDIWPIEWEVISNETNWKEYKAPNNKLEEVVQSETVYPESKMLSDNWKNNVPVDFTSMPWIDPKWNVFKGFNEVQEINKAWENKPNPK